MDSIIMPHYFFTLFSLYLLFIPYFKKIKDYNYSTVLILAYILVISVIHLRAYSTDAEDSYIAYRYAENFSEGNGLVFNLNERVEGYSDFLWIVLVGMVHKIMGIAIPTVARILGLVFYLLSIVLSYQIGKKISNCRTTGFASALLLSASGTFACYSWSGLESCLFTFLFLTTLLLLLTIRSPFFIGLCVALMVMTRPEGVLMIPIIIVYKLFFDKDNLKFFVLNFLIGTACFLVPWSIWRVSYYGYILPNAMAAKMGMDFNYQLKSGLRYILGYYDATFFMSSLTISLTLWLYINEKLHTKHIVLLLCIIIYTTFNMLVGGDWMPAWRFFVGIAPILSIYCASLLFEKKLLGTPNTKLVVVIILCILTVYNSFANPKMVKEVGEWKYDSVEGLAYIGKWFQQKLPRSTVVATFPNGAFSFYNRLHTIDVLGLTDEHIARRGKRKKRGTPGHIAYDYEYVLNQKPDILAMMGGQGFVTDVGNPDPRFINYDHIIFEFKRGGRNVNHKYVELYFLKTKSDTLVKLLALDQNNIVSIKKNSLSYDH